METINEVDLIHVNLEELEQMALEYRLGKQAQARMAEEAKYAHELEIQLKILDGARTYLPVALQGKVKFSHYSKRGNEFMVDYAAMVLVETETWRIYVRLNQSRNSRGEISWSLDQGGFIATSPELENDDDAGWYILWRSEMGTNNLLEAVAQAMDHQDLEVLQLVADQRNAAGIKAPVVIREPVYLPAEDPQGQGNVLIGELVELVRGIVSEELGNRSL